MELPRTNTSARTLLIVPFSVPLVSMSLAGDVISLSTAQSTLIEVTDNNIA